MIVHWVYNVDIVAGRFKLSGEVNGHRETAVTEEDVQRCCGSLFGFDTAHGEIGS